MKIYLWWMVKKNSASSYCTDYIYRYEEGWVLVLFRILQHLHNVNQNL